MEKAILFLLITFSACMGPKQNTQNEDDEFYSNAFCILLEAKQNFRTPELKGDSIRILDYYYIDSTSLYYNFTNSSFEVQFIDTIDFPQLKGGVDDYKKYKTFSSLRDFRGIHQVNVNCLKQKKIKFISKEEITDKFQAYNTLVYSPIINYKNDLYKIYEDRLTQYEDIYYVYIFKRVNNNFEFVKRTYHSDVFLQVKMII